MLFDKKHIIKVVLMAYNYEKEKKQLDTKMLASITSTAQSLLDTAGAFTFPYVTREIKGKIWSMIACVDYLVEIGFIREITNKDILAERVFVKGVKR